MGNGEESILHMAAGSGPVVFMVLILLIVLSIWSWAITVAKVLQFKKAMEESGRFSEMFWEIRNLAKISEASAKMEASPISQVFQGGYKELHQLLEEREEQDVEEETSSKTSDRDGEIDSLEMALKKSILNEVNRLDKGVTFLATVASAAPFIGLFGTVWGIMNAFQGLSNVKTTTLQAVAPGISEALVATAIGLAAAIPASVAYNYFTVTIKKIRASMEQFSQEFLTIASRHFI